jgi:hypothetical protein
MINDESAKMGEVADTPRRINLQLFAEGDPAPSDPAPADPAPGAPTEPADPEPGKPPAQDPATNAAFADMRRQKEGLETKLKAADAWVAENFGESHGLKTWDEYQEALKKEKERQSYQSASTDPDKLQELINKNVDDKINQHPAVKQANELLGKQKLQEEIDSLNKEYPELKIKSLDDLNKLPNVEKIYDRHINKGLSLLEAYELVNRPHKVDVGKIKEDGVKEYFDKLKTNKRPVEGGGPAPVIVTETPKTFEAARKGAMEMLRQMNKT